MFTEDPLSSVLLIDMAVPFTIAYSGTVLLLYVTLFVGVTMVT
jgi:hypothetical protein